VRTQRATVLIGVLATGLVLTQQACTPLDREIDRPVAFTAPVPSTSAGKPAEDPILAGERQVVIKPIPSSESIVAVDDRGRLTLTDGEVGHSLFVLTPSGGKYLIRTTAAACLGIRTNPGGPLTVEAAPCDAGRPGQLFTINPQKTKDQGRPTYAISNQDAFLQVFPRSGLVAEELGDAPLKTTFAFVDNGPSTLPSLD
jgi:hypothetical protein